VTGGGSVSRTGGVGATGCASTSQTAG
jgi:hypothetical protein